MRKSILTHIAVLKLIIFVSVCNCFGKAEVSQLADDVYKTFIDKNVIITSVNGFTMDVKVIESVGGRILVIDGNCDNIMLEKKEIASIILNKSILVPTREHVVSNNSHHIPSSAVLISRQLEEKNRLFSLYENKVKSAQKLTGIGEVLLTSGCVFTAAGVLGLVVDYSTTYNKKDYNSSSNSGTNDFEKWDVIGCWCVCLGVPLVLSGHIIGGIGKAKLSKAEYYKDQYETISYRINPLVNPFSDTYGVSLNFTF